MDITIKLNKYLVECAPKKVLRMGKTIEQQSREDIQHLADCEDYETWTEEPLQLSGLGNSGGWKFNRDEIHGRD